jgi:hypothetical protein
MKENSKAYMCSGFFTIDKEGSDNQRHLDFYVPGEKKMFSFKLEKKVEKVPVEMAIEKIPKKLESDFDFEFEEIEKMVRDQMQKQKIANKLQKIIISLQSIGGKNMLVCTAFISMLGLLKVHIDLKKKKIILFEKKSFFDMLKRVK